MIKKTKERIDAIAGKAQVAAIGDKDILNDHEGRIRELEYDNEILLGVKDACDLTVAWDEISVKAVVLKILDRLGREIHKVPVSICLRKKRKEKNYLVLEKKRK